MSKQATYYSEDTEQRKRYFLLMFLKYSAKIARLNGVSTEVFLSRMKNFNDFKDTLKIAWSQDTSLLNYLEGMSQSDLREFYNRQEIQNFINMDKENIQETLDNIPSKVFQVEGKPRVFRMGKVKEKRTIVYKDSVKRRGKTQIVYRNKLGRFASVK